MLFLVSPAKALDETAAPEQIEKTSLAFGKQAEELMAELKQLGPVDVAHLMHLSDKLADLNYERFQAWQYPFENTQSKQAVLLFKGDVYQGLEASSLTTEGLSYLQTHLRILSGLYGLLKPLDGILPYRLEMGTKFQNAKGKDLYAFWEDQITDLLNQQLAEQDSRIVVNLASNEYFKAVKKKTLNAEIITPQFKDWKNGQYKMISFYAKRARGLMARYAAVNQVEQVEDLKYFDYDGYQFAPDLSSEKDWVFTRKQTD